MEVYIQYVSLLNLIVSRTSLVFKVLYWFLEMQFFLQRAF